MLVAESLLNLACVGARPLAVVNCLNFGNPEHPEVMWQLSEAVDGMAEACRVLDVPVVGGNVSLYNESAGTDIDPTPVIGLLGIVDRLERRPPGATLVDGHRLLLLGPEAAGLGGSRWGCAQGAPGGRLPELDLTMVAAVAELVRGLVIEGLVDGVHDVSSGGLGVALAEMAVRSGIGVHVARVADHRALFGEAPGRVVVAVHPDWLVEVLERTGVAGVPTSRIGLVGGDRFTVKGLFDIALDEVVSAFTDRLPEALGVGTSSR